MHVLGPIAPHQQAGDLGFLIARLAIMEDRPDLEQGHIRISARLIAGRSLQQTGQQIGAHMAHLGRDRVFQLVASSPPPNSAAEA